MKHFWLIAAIAFSPYATAQVSSGTAFAVAPGILVTNQHVVDSCRSIEVITPDGRRTGSIIDDDEQIDLALLRVTGLRGATASLRSPRNVRLGESVMVFGFPLSGSLTSGGNFTSGLVSGLRGLRDAAGEIQITAPVQPGNSGGPVVDASGLVVGVVQAKLDALRSAISTGDIPQNVNFAISLEVLADFLAKNKVAVRNAPSTRPLDTASVAELAKGFTYRVECRGTAQRAAAPKQAPTPADPSANERAFWESVKDTRNPDELKAYLNQFPKGLFVALAQARLRALTPAPPLVATLPGGDAEAQRLFRRATEQNDAIAQVNLGVMYMEGRGGLAKDDVEAVRLFKLAAAQNHAGGQSNLGFMYQNGRGGLVKDGVEAVRLYKLAAAQNYAGGQSNLGVMYSEGHGGLAKDEVEAVRLYKLAAAQNNAPAQVNLGARYANGRGVAKDDVEAVRLYKLAAAQNNAFAQVNLGWVYMTNSEMIDYAEAMKWNLSGANNGAGEGASNVGLLYEKGWGVPADLKMAAFWYQKAILIGPHSGQAELGLGKLYESGLGGIPKNLAEATRLYRIALVDSTLNEKSRKEAQERLAAMGQ